jgi:hypothetical protein
MVDKQEGEWVVPNPQIPRTFGMMNIVFGGLLLLLGVGYLAFYVISPMFTKQMVEEAHKQQAVKKAEREAKITELKTKEGAAKTKEEKADLQAERENLEKEIEPDVSDIIGFNMYSDTRLAIYYFSEVIAGILLNLLMLISGIGLLGLAEWARRLAVAVAWGKILRWVAIVIVAMVLVLPITMQKMQKMFDSIDQQTKARSGGRATPIPMGSLAQYAAIMGAVTVVFEAVVFSIYPGLSIWFLTRPRVRAACLAKSPTIPLLPGDGPGELT